MSCPFTGNSVTTYLLLMKAFLPAGTQALVSASFSVSGGQRRASITGRQGAAALAALEAAKLSVELISEMKINRRDEMAKL